MTRWAVVAGFACLFGAGVRRRECAAGGRGATSRRPATSRPVSSGTRTGPATSRTARPTGTARRDPRAANGVGAGRRECDDGNDVADDGCERLPVLLPRRHRLRRRAGLHRRPCADASDGRTCRHDLVTGACLIDGRAWTTTPSIRPPVHAVRSGDAHRLTGRRWPKAPRAGTACSATGGDLHRGGRLHGARPGLPRRLRGLVRRERRRVHPRRRPRSSADRPWAAATRREVRRRVAGLPGGRAGGGRLCLPTVAGRVRPGGELHGDRGDCPVDAIIPEGTACDDLLACSISDACNAAGVCVGTEWLAPGAPVPYRRRTGRAPRRGGGHGHQRPAPDVPVDGLCRGRLPDADLRACRSTTRARPPVCIVRLRQPGDR